MAPGSAMTLRAALASCGIAGVCAVAIAHATPPAANGNIAFQRYLLQDDPLQADVWVERADGSGEREVTHAPRGFIDGEPDWSPDAKRIVFQRGPSVDGPWTLWLVDADGSRAHRLSPTRGRCLDESSPAFSPDGRRIAFECHDHVKHGELFSIVVMNVDRRHRHVAVRGTGAAGVGR